MEENKYGLSEPLWDELTLAARITFNKHYEAMCKYNELMQHPQMKPIKHKHWLTIAFNSAYICALLIDGRELPKVLGENDYPLMPN